MCFIGADRTYPPESEAVMETERTKFLRQRCSADNTSSVSSSVQFVPRPDSEKPRNAVAIDDGSKQLIWTSVLAAILCRATDLVALNDRTWNKGGAFACTSTLLPRIRSDIPGGSKKYRAGKKNAVTSK